MRFVLVALLLAGCAPPAPLIVSNEPLPSRAAAASVAATPSPPEATPTAAATPTAGLTFTGSGQQSTEVFELAAGDYLVTWEMTGGRDGCFYSVDLVPIGHEEFVLIYMAGASPDSGSDTTRLDGGRYALDVYSCGDWTVTISPR